MFESNNYDNQISRHHYYLSLANYYHWISLQHYNEISCHNYLSLANYHYRISLQHDYHYWISYNNFILEDHEHHHLP